MFVKEPMIRWQLFQVIVLVNVLSYMYNTHVFCATSYTKFFATFYALLPSEIYWWHVELKNNQEVVVDMNLHMLDLLGLECSLLQFVVMFLHLLL